MPLSLPASIPSTTEEYVSEKQAVADLVIKVTTQALLFGFQNVTTASNIHEAVYSSTTAKSVPSFVTVDHPFIVFAREIYLWLVPTMVTILTISIIGNGLIVISAPWLGRHINPYNRLCISLAAADAWAASLLITGLIVNSYMPVVLRIQKKSECVAAVLEIFRISGMLTSNLHILALAINQFIGIVYPLKYKKTQERSYTPKKIGTDARVLKSWCHRQDPLNVNFFIGFILLAFDMIVTTKRVRILILLLWLIPVAFVGSWFVSIPHDGFRHPRCTHRFYSRFPFRLSVFTSFVIPLLSTFALYALILITLLKAKAKYSSRLRRSTRSSYRRRVKSKLKLVWTTLLILSTFTLSWGVCVLYFLLVCIEGCAFIYLKSVSFHAGFLMNSTVNFLVTLKLLLNPLIYALRMQHIRDSVFELLNSICLHAFRHRFLYRGSSLPHNQTMDTELVSRRLSTQNSENNGHSHVSNGHKNKNHHNNNYMPMGQPPLTNSHSSFSSTSQSARSREQTSRPGPNIHKTRLRHNLGRLSAPLELFRLLENRSEGDKNKTTFVLGNGKNCSATSESSEDMESG